MSAAASWCALSVPVNPGRRISSLGFGFRIQVQGQDSRQDAHHPLLSGSAQSEGLGFKVQGQTAGRLRTARC